MIKTLRYLVLGVILALCSATAQAQEHKMLFKNYDAQQWLPGDSPKNIIQDSQGYLWVSTLDGLIKFDGYEMEFFQVNRSDSSQLWLRDQSGGLMQATDGKIWMAMNGIDGGVAFYNPRKEVFTNFTTSPVDSALIPYDRCRLMFEDVTGALWLASSTGNRDKLALSRIGSETFDVHNYYFNDLGIDSLYIPDVINPIVLNFQTAESLRDSSIWINFEGSEKGEVWRFDRRKDTFEQVFSGGDTLPGTSDTEIIDDLYPPLQSGLIPMGNSQVLYLFDPQKREVVKTFDFFHYPKRRNWRGGVVEDAYGQIWRTADGNIDRISPTLDRIDHFELGSGELSYLEVPKPVRRIIPWLSDSSSIWFVLFSNTSKASFLQYHHSSKRFDYYDPEFNDSNNNMRFIFNPILMRDLSGLIWLSGGMLQKQDPKRQQFSTKESVHTRTSKVDLDSISSIYQDSFDNYWLQQAGKLVVLDKNFQMSPINRYFSGVFDAENQPRVPVEDSEKNVWISSTNGLYKWNPSKSTFTKLFKGVVFGIKEDNNGLLWAEVDDHILVFDKFGNKKRDFTLAGRWFVNIFHDSKGNTWLPNYPIIGSLSKLTSWEDDPFAFSQDDDLPGDFISYIVEDSLQNLWLGGGSLTKYDSKSHTFSEIIYQSAPIETSGYGFDSTNGIWFTTYGIGIISVDPISGEVSSFDKSRGLQHNNVVSMGQDEILRDKNGNFWVCTPKGLSVFNPFTFAVSNYSENDGFEGGNYYAINGLNSNSGDVVIGNNAGLYVTNPDKLLEKDQSLPQVLITSVTINNKTYKKPDMNLFSEAVSFSTQVVLSYDQKDLGFDFLALHYLRPEDNLYRWKLENYDQAWSLPSRKRTANYTNLSPGSYVFRVQGSNADGVWDEDGAAMRIVINPPFWLTAWAYTLYVFLFLAGVYGVHVFQKTRLLRKEKERSRQKELEQAREIERAYNNLKDTQQKLIQSEKMASLGELTAGIAHEIQNPLNFVNNFAEVSGDLVKEIQEERQKIKDRDEELTDDILNDIEENLEKIAHHGKRASGIVKGMLEHSRTGDGTKEPTDINALADEYLRLAYHGLRAKDKSFNADFSLEADENLQKINVVPQDLGRVLLNLVNNAFHAVNERSKNESEKYQPLVTLRTSVDPPLPAGQASSKGGKGGVVITVKDNGPGIPDNIKDKIFQPFFTTKPTGEGTGLGLSLSYDIVTKGHGGTMELESKEGTGTTFIVKIPV